METKIPAHAIFGKDRVHSERKEAGNFFFNREDALTYINSKKIIKV